MINNHAILTAGLPACGKSTYANKHKNSYHILERDMVRKELYKVKNNKDFTWSDWDNSMESEVTKIYQQKLVEMINSNVNIILSDTWLNKKFRTEMIKFLKMNGYQVTVVVFKTPMHICIARNMKRNISNRVPDIAYENMARNFTIYCHTESKGFKQESLEYGYDVISIT